MKYTNRLGLKMPDQDDAYQVDDFNENYQKISEAFAGVPQETTYTSIEIFCESQNAADMRKGDVVKINDVLYLLNADDGTDFRNYIPYGATGIVIMTPSEYVNISDRTEQSIYALVTRTRGLIVKVFKKFYHSLFQITAQTSVQGGMSFTLIDGGINVSGASNEDIDFEVGTIQLHAGTTYALKGCADGGSEESYCVKLGDKAVDYGSGASYTCEENEEVTVSIFVANGQVSTGMMFHPRVVVTNGETGGKEDNVYIKETTSISNGVWDEKKYRFTFRNVDIVTNENNPARAFERMYFVADNS